MATKRDRSNYLIQSVSHSLDVLEALAKAESEIGITELSKQLGLHKNNVFRLLATLGLKGFVLQNRETEAYSLGPACLKLGQAYLLSCDLVDRIRPFLMDLSEQTSETVSFARLINTHVHFPISISSNKQVSVSARIGKSIPASDCAVGNLLLAQEDKETLGSYSASLKKKLSNLDGVSYHVDQSEEDVLCIVMLVRGIGNSVIGAVEVMAPAYRTSTEKILPMLSEVVNSINNCFAAEEISLADRIEREVTKGQKGSGLDVDDARL